MRKHKCLTSIVQTIEEGCDDENMLSRVPWLKDVARCKIVPGGGEEALEKLARAKGERCL